MQAKLMGVCSLLAVTVTLTLHLTGARDIHRAISLELAAGNPLAWTLIVALCGVVVLLAHKLFVVGHVVRTVLLLLVVPSLLVVGLTPPQSGLHLLLFILVCLLVWGWFGITALDNDNSFLVGLSCSMIVVPVLFLLSPGLGERALIMYALVSCSLVYYIHLDDCNPIPWKTVYNPETNASVRSDSEENVDWAAFSCQQPSALPVPLLWSEPDEG